MHSNEPQHRPDSEIHQDHQHITMRADEYPEVPDYQRWPHGGEAPHDPGVAGFVGKRRAVQGWWPDPNGNRGERRAAAKAGRKRHAGGKGGTHRGATSRRR